MTYPTISTEVVLPRALPRSRVPSHTLLLEILDLARWAPSGDNRQLWRVRRTPEGAEILLRDGDLGFLDRGPAMRIALGAFGESFRLAAGKVGISAETHFEPRGESGGGAKLAFGQHRTSSLGNTSLGALLPLRCSNRRLYQPGSCSASELHQLAAEVIALPHVDLSWISGERLIPLSRALALGEKLRLSHSVCHRDFHSKVRWSKEEAEADPTGFWVDTFEIKWHERAFLRWTRSWGLFRALNAVFRVAKMAAACAQRQVQQSGAVVVFSLRDQSAASWIEVGRALQRVWLRATSLGLSAQVLGVAPIFLHRLRHGGGGLSAGQRGMVTRMAEELNAIDGMPHSDDLALMLRLGRAKAPTARAGRLPAAMLLGEGGSSAPSGGGRPWSVSDPGGSAAARQVGSLS